MIHETSCFQFTQQVSIGWEGEGRHGRVPFPTRLPNYFPMVESALSKANQISYLLIADCVDVGEMEVSDEIASDRQELAAENPAKYANA
jgi:hypothetical protein